MSEYVHTLESAAHRWWAWEGAARTRSVRIASRPRTPGA
jgi:hypothetical protein